MQKITMVATVKRRYIKKGDRMKASPQTRMTTSYPNLSQSLVANKMSNEMGTMLTRMMSEFVDEEIGTP